MLFLFRPVPASLMVVLALPASADGPGLSATVTTPALTLSTADWSGFYVGGQAALGRLDGTEEGRVLGLHAGYQRDFGQLVGGVEFAFDRTDITEELIPGSLFFRDVDSVARLGLRLGVDAGRVLPYVTGGLSLSRFTDRDEDPDPLLNTGSDTFTQGGHFVGAGVAIAVTERLVVGTEGVRHVPTDYGDLDVTVVSLRMSYRF